MPLLVSSSLTSWIRWHLTAAEVETLEGSWTGGFAQCHGCILLSKELNHGRAELWTGRLAQCY